MVDSSLFILRHGKFLVFLLVYVDDIVLTGNSPSFLQSLILQLSSEFELKDLRNLHYFLGLHITRTSRGIFLNRSKYAHDLLQKHNMLSAKPTRHLVHLTSDWFLLLALCLLTLMNIEVLWALYTI